MLGESLESWSRPLLLYGPDLVPSGGEYTAVAWGFGGPDVAEPEPHSRSSRADRDRVAGALARHRTAQWSGTAIVWPSTKELALTRRPNATSATLKPGHQPSAIPGSLRCTLIADVSAFCRGA